MKEKVLPLEHDDVVLKIIRFARAKDIPFSAQVYLIESALEYLAVRRLLPEENISQWPETGMIGGFQAVQERIKDIG